MSPGRVELASLVMVSTFTPLSGPIRILLQRRLDCDAGLFLYCDIPYIWRAASQAAKSERKEERRDDILTSIIIPVQCAVITSCCITSPGAELSMAGIFVR